MKSNQENSNTLDYFVNQLTIALVTDSPVVNINIDRLGKILKEYQCMDKALDLISEDYFHMIFECNPKSDQELESFKNEYITAAKNILFPKEKRKRRSKKTNEN